MAAQVENGEIVIRIPFPVLTPAALFSRVKVTDVAKFAEAVVAELNAEDTDEDTYLNKFLDAAIVRAAEADAPGAEFVEID